MTKYKPRCSYIGCDPVEGQCLGFCESKEMPVQFAEPEPVESDLPQASGDVWDKVFLCLAGLLLGLMAKIFFSS